MGNHISNLFSENINQTQLTSINQTCNQSATARITDPQIVAIDSHLGDINISASVNVGDMNCVMGAVSSQTATAAVANTTLNDIQSLPFQAVINGINNTDITDIQSFQQAIINQSCIQSAFAGVEDARLTFIDSSTGNITIAASSKIDSFNCNLQASTYQSATATVQDTASNKISVSCCGFDLGMLIPIVLGLIGLIVVSKMATKQSGGQTESLADQLAKVATADAALRQAPRTATKL